MSTNLEQSRRLDKVAREIRQICTHKGGRADDWASCPDCKGACTIHPYAESGTAGWLRAKKGSEWPSLIWVWDKSLERARLCFAAGFNAMVSEADSGPMLYNERLSYGLNYVHALDYLDAFALLEKVGWYWERHHTVLSGIEYWAYRERKRSAALCANTPEELLDKMLAEEK